MSYSLDELRTFLLVANTQSFTKAAAQLGVARSAVSHSIAQLEKTMGVRLFNRTTRQVATTDAGQQLYQQLAPLLERIDNKIDEVLSSQRQMQGTIRITGTPHALEYELWDKLCQFNQQYPAVTLEIHSQIRLVDIVAERYDVGIRSGNMVNNDMIAVRVSEPVIMCVVATPEYLSTHPTIATPDDLVQHQCIRLRLPTHGGLLDWQFYHPNTHEVTTHVVQGNLIFNDAQLMIKAVKQGQGLLWLERSTVIKEIERGELQEVLHDWALLYPAYYLYYPNRGNSPLLKTFIEALKI